MSNEKNANVDLIALALAIHTFSKLKYGIKSPKFTQPCIKGRSSEI